MYQKDTRRIIDLVRQAKSLHTKGVNKPKNTGYDEDIGDIRKPEKPT